MLYNEVLIHNQVTKRYSNNKFQLWLFLSVFLPFPYYFTLTASLLPVFPFHWPSREEYLLIFLSHTCLLVGRPPQHLSAAVLPLHSVPRELAGRPGEISLSPQVTSAQISCTFPCWLSPDSPILPFLAQILEETFLQNYTATFASCRLSYISQQPSACIEGILYVFLPLLFPCHFVQLIICWKGMTHNVVVSFL